MADEDRFYVEDEFVMDRQTGDVKYDDMRGRVGQIVAELLNYVEALEQSQSTVASSARAGALEEAAKVACPLCQTGDALHYYTTGWPLPFHKVNGRARRCAAGLIHNLRKDTRPALR